MSLINWLCGPSLAEGVGRRVQGAKGSPPSVNESKEGVGPLQRGLYMARLNPHRPSVFIYACEYVRYNVVHI